MRIVAVRHGQTEGNVSQIIQSRTDGKLSELGIQQAKVTADRLKDQTFDAIYCSTLGRCKETLGYIKEFHQEVPVHFSDLLMELDKGELDGKHWSDLPDDFYSSNNVDNKLPGGESWNELANRLQVILNEIFNAGYQSVLIVTHDGPLRVLHALLDTISLGDAIGIGYENAGIYKFEMHELFKQKLGQE